MEHDKYHVFGVYFYVFTSEVVECIDDVFEGWFVFPKENGNDVKTDVFVDIRFLDVIVDRLYH